MIIRKPYAFLIKYFKVIHIVIFLIFGYFLFAFRDIYMFFKDAVVSNSIYGRGLEDKYVSFLFILMGLMLLGLSFAIYFLMRKKNKPVLFYRLIMGYAIFTIVLFGIYRSYFTNVGTGVDYTPNTLVLYRDMAAIIYYSTYLFVGFSFARAFGFDIKKFSFDKDKKELNISSSDSEEYELNINLDKDKILNQIRKEKRHVKYYIEDNKKILIKLGIGLVSLIFVYVLIVIFVFHRAYSMRTWIDIPNYASSFMLDKVYLTNRDPYQENNDKKHNYVGVIFKMRVGGYNIALDNRFLRMKLDGKYYYSTHQSSSTLSDLAPLYNGGDILYANKEVTKLFLYSYDSSIKSRDISFEVLLNGDYHLVRSDYIEQYNTDKGFVLKDIKLGETVPIFDGGFTVNGYKLHDHNPEYQYLSRNCTDGECKTLTKRIQPKINEKVLELNVKYNDTKDNNQILEYYLSLEYDIKGKTYLNSARSVTILDHVSLSDGQRIYLSVNANLLKADKRYLIITTREAKYKLLINDEE